MRFNSMVILGAVLALWAVATPVTAQLNLPILGGGNNNNNNNNNDNKNSNSDSKSNSTTGISIGVGNNTPADPPTRTASVVVVTPTETVIVGPTGQRNLKPDADNGAIAIARFNIDAMILSIHFH
ncbi:hypothetical protein BDF19DRAFT_448781 [Syncephalis fuscata]|nr:hypothetical protein BDF19DRAFT_448781 [Syncephalis fuscata]